MSLVTTNTARISGHWRMTSSTVTVPRTLVAKFRRVFVGGQDESLDGQVYDHLGACGLEQAGDRDAVVDVGLNEAALGAEAE